MKSHASAAARAVLLPSLLCAAASAAGIYGGDEAAPRRYPYAVSLQDDGRSFCGGSLIAADVVLSAAHCQRSRRNWLGWRGRNWLGLRRVPYRAVVGRQALDDSDVGGEYAATKEVIHPEYFVHGDDGVVQVTSALQSLRIDNDFMLVVLKKPVADDGAASLVGLNPSDSIPGEQMRLTVMGWGDTAVGEEYVPSRTLLEASGRAISNEECLTKRGASVTYKDAITDNEMCMAEYNEGEFGRHQQGMCSGDSGGPLVVRGKGPETDLQVGVVSWGPCGSNRELPGVYARVSSQYEWIVQTVCQESDYPPPSFGCPPKKRGVSVTGIVLAVFSGVVFVVASVVACIQCKRNKEKLKEEEAAQLVDNLHPRTEYNLL